jgi:hypothetical protein
MREREGRANRKRQKPTMIVYFDALQDIFFP